jgi:uncharacterized protein
MKIRILRIVCISVLILVFVAGSLFFWPKDAAAPLEMATTSIAVSGKTYTILLARTMSEKRTGLGGVERLEPYAGMLFVLEDGEGGGMWMDGMLIPLDLLWLSEDGTVLKLEEEIAASDRRVFAHDPAARYVLEVDAGFAAEHGVKAGSTIGLFLDDE